MILLAPVSKQPKSSFDFERSSRRCPQLLILELIAPRWPERRRLLCRFSDAGMTRLSTHCGGRRPKRQGTKSREVGHRWCRGRYGDLTARPPCSEASRTASNRRLQPLRYLHDCSDCFRLERLPGGIFTHWKAPPLHGAHPFRTLGPSGTSSSFRPMEDVEVSFLIWFNRRHAAECFAHNSSHLTAG